MGLLIRISLRNLLRQKRRNLLLGTAIGIGMAILVIANSFSHGISDVLFNRIMSYVTGHVSVAFTRNGNVMRPLFRDGDRMMETVRKAIPEAKEVSEGIGLFARAIGNSRTDNVILVGMNMTGPQASLDQLKEDFPMEEGSFDGILRADIENPVLVAKEKAAYLNIKVGDALRVRFPDIHGANQAARLTVVGIFNPSNVFMTAPVFLNLPTVRRLAGYGPHDIGQVYITLPEPKEMAVPAADRLHALLKPPLAAAHGRMRAGNPDGRTGKADTAARMAEVTALGFKVDSASLRGLGKLLSPLLPEGRDTLLRTDVLMSHALAESLGAKAGDACTLRYRAKHDSSEAAVSFTIDAVLPPSPLLPGNILLVNDRDFYGFFYDHWPETARSDAGAFLPGPDHALHPFLSREWLLLERTATTEAMQKKYREITRLKTRATTVDVQTMYESASMIVRLEYALNLITLAAVLILFFIIQVGVVNTLRMTIRERTREIGTIRAIGMQRGDVRNLFLMETFFLSLFACLAGIVLAFAAMYLLGRIPFHAQGNPLAMLLVDGRLHFMPSLTGILLYLALILAIAAATAWFPARRAANLPAAEALGHFG